MKTNKPVSRKRKVYMTKKRKQYIALTKIFIATSFILGSYFAGVLSETSHHHTNSIPEIRVIERVQAVEVPVYMPITKDEVINEIVKQANENPSVSVYDAIRVSKCESEFNDQAKSRISSAKGVYQFIDKTWENYCEGDRMNYKDNIACFMELYPKHKDWWECK